MEVVKIIGIALCGVVLSVVLKQHRGEYQIFIALACGIAILFLSIDYIQRIFYELSVMVDQAGINRDYFSLLLKAVGISCLCEIGINLCRDAGESAIASKLELAGKLILLFLALPVFSQVLSLLVGIVR